MLRRDVGAEQLGNFGANDLVRIDCHLGSGGFAGANGPDGFVGDDDRCGGLGVMPAKAPVTCVLSTCFGLAGFALGQNFADADDGNDAVLERGVQLLVDDLIGLGKVLAALGVADERVGSTDGDELADEVSPV